MAQKVSKKFAVILSGCGFKDGAEITESVCTLIALSELHVGYDLFAPDITIEATDHLTGKNSGPRSLLAESARIARGEIQDIQKLNANNYDGIIFPGGYGAAKHLCTFESEGAKCSVLPSVKRTIEDFHKQEKPIGAFCIAPVIIAKVLGSHGVTVTIGNDADTAKEIEKTGAQHAICTVDDFITDREFKVVTSPAYMYEAKPCEVFSGIRKAIKELVEMA